LKILLSQGYAQTVFIDYNSTHTAQFANIRKFQSLHCCSIVYLQHIVDTMTSPSTDVYDVEFKGLYIVIRLYAGAVVKSTQRRLSAIYRLSARTSRSWRTMSWCACLPPILRCWYPYCLV